MSWKALAIVAILAAGCSQGPQNGSQGPDATVVTDPRDLANGTSPGSHIHDYWDNQKEIQVIDESLGTSSQSSDASMPVVYFRPREGQTILQGTGAVEVTADWQLDQAPVGSLVIQNNFESLELWVQTAVDNEPRRAGTLEQGIPVVFNSTNEWNDPPHFVLSLWRFQVVAQGDGDGTGFSGTMNLQATIVRGLPLPVFPPHPDAWNGSTEILLAEFDQEVNNHVQTPTLTNCSGCLPFFAPADGLTVPADASQIVIEVTPSPDSTPGDLALYYHGADTYNLTKVTGDGLPGPRTFTLAVEGRGDSPYAKQSLWEFNVGFGNELQSGAWAGSLHIKAVVKR